MSETTEPAPRTGELCPAQPCGTHSAKPISPIMPSSSLLDINTLQLAATFSLPQTIYEASSTLRLAIDGTRRVFLVPRSISFQEIQRAPSAQVRPAEPRFFLYRLVFPPPRRSLGFAKFP